MPKKRPTDEEANYFLYPFPGTTVLIRPALKKAFAGSNNGQELDTNLLNGFSFGRTPYELSLIQLSSNKEVGLVTKQTNFDLDPDLSRRGIQEKLKKWREILFSNNEYVAHIFERLCKNARDQENYTNYLKPFFDFIIENGIYKNLSTAEKSKRMLLWGQLKECIYGCKNGLTLNSFTEEFHQVGVFEIMMMEWRVMRGEAAENPHFLRWKVENYDKVFERYFSMRKQYEGRQSCFSCKFPELRNWDHRILESVYFYFTRFNPSGDLDFYKHFVAAAIATGIRFELLFGLFHLRDLHLRMQNWSPEDKDMYEFLLNEVDIARLQLCQHTTNAMVECLFHHNSGGEWPSYELSR